MNMQLEAWMQYFFVSTSILVFVLRTIIEYFSTTGLYKIVYFIFLMISPKIIYDIMTRLAVGLF